MVIKSSDLVDFSGLLKAKLNTTKNNSFNDSNQMNKPVDWESMDQFTQSDSGLFQFIYQS